MQNYFDPPAPASPQPPLYQDIGNKIHGCSPKAVLSLERGILLLMMYIVKIKVYQNNTHWFK